VDRDKGKDMKIKITGLALGGILLALCVSAEAQQPKKVSRIAILTAQSPSASSSRVEAFRNGLVELGYTEGVKTLRLSTDTQTGGSNDYLIWRRR
jgi:hypothetical protein